MSKNTNTRFLLTEPKYSTAKGRPQLLRVEFANDYTKFDFGYQTTSFYIKGGWVRIAPETFIRIKSSGQKLILTRAINIPITPTHHHFDTTKDWLYFSLFFPPMETRTDKIDLIEAEPGEDTDFNYFDIVIDKKKMIELY